MTIEFLLAPTLGIIVGLAILFFVGYINWYGNIKAKSVDWISQKLYRKSVGSEALSDGLFMTITSILLAMGGILIIYSVLFF